MRSGLRLPTLSPRAHRAFLLRELPSDLARQATQQAPPPAAEPPPGGGRRFPARAGGSLLLGVDPEGEDVVWNLDALSNAFLCAFGASGSGKTVLLRAIAAACTLPVVVIDFHGDLKAKGETWKPASAGDVSPLEIVSERGPADQASRFADGVSRAVPQLGHIQKAQLHRAVLAAYAEAGVKEGEKATWAQTPSVKALVRHVGDAKSAASRGLVAALDNLFGGASAPTPLNLHRLLTAGGRCDLTALTRPAQILAAETLLEQIWAALMQAGHVPGRRYRCLVLVDESAILKNSRILEVLIRESRKFGCALVLASQAPSDLPGAIVNNCAALVQMRLGSPSEARIAARLLRGPSAEELLALSRPGQAYFRGGDRITPLRVLPVNAPERKA